MSIENGLALSAYIGVALQAAACTCVPSRAKPAESKTETQLSETAESAKPSEAQDHQTVSKEQEQAPKLSPASDQAKVELVPPPLPETPFPPNLPLEEPTELPITGDRMLRVTHAPQTNLHPIVYLHGMCGNSKGADPWADIAASYGTLVVVRANVPCEDRPGYRWPKDLDAIQTRIDAALERVKEERGGWLDTEHPSLFGYSQGAYRAEQLVGAFPERYERAVLGGPPTPPSYEALKSLKAVAVLGGELENHEHMLEGTHELIDHGSRARFFLLPKVHHGSYGPSGRKVVGQALRFVFEP